MYIQLRLGACPLPSADLECACAVQRCHVSELPQPFYGLQRRSKPWRAARTSTTALSTTSSKSSSTRTRRTCLRTPMLFNIFGLAASVSSVPFPQALLPTLQWRSTHFMRAWVSISTPPSLVHVSKGFASPVSHVFSSSSPISSTARSSHLGSHCELVPEEIPTSHRTQVSESYYTCPY